jgi:hypothetical protein
MSDYVPQIKAALDELAPRFDEPDDEWEVLVRRARGARTRVGVATAAFVSLVVAFVALPALGFGRGLYWRALFPTKPDLHFVVASGTSSTGAKWVASTDGDHGRVLAISVNGRGVASSAGIDSGMRGGVPPGPRWISFDTYLSVKPPFQLIVGPAAEGVARVDVKLADGETINANLAKAPAGLHTRLQFYYRELAATRGIRALLAYDARGVLLQRMSIATPSFSHCTAKRGTLICRSKR